MRLFVVKNFAHLIEKIFTILIEMDRKQIPAPLYWKNPRVFYTFVWRFLAVC